MSPASASKAAVAPEAHPVLFRKGLSLEASGLAEAAITHWQTMLITSTRLLGTGTSTR